MRNYAVYYFCIILAAIFAELSQIFAKDKNNAFKLNKFFYITSFLFLFVLIGLRKCGVGVDDYVYQDIFYDINNGGMIDTFFNIFLEPGYLLLNRIVGFFTDDFQVLLAIASFIPLFCYYKMFEYYRREIDFFTAIIVFGFVFVLYFFGIVRLFISTGICAYAFRYFFEKKQKKFNAFIILAAMFHYSALILIILNLLINKEHNKKNLTKFYLIIALGIPLVFIVISKFIFPYVSFKYAGYVLNNNFKISLLNFDKVPFIILYYIFYGYLIKSNKNIKMHIVIFSLSIIISVYSSLVDFGRLEWYFAIEQCILLPMLVKSFSRSRNAFINFILVPLVLVYCFLYSNRMFHAGDREHLYNNYQNVIFNIKK